jgi:hypothetical protein
VVRPVASVVVGTLALAILGCEAPAEPPMTAPREPHLALPGDAGPPDAAPPEEAREPDAGPLPGAVDFPGELAAIAFETSIYEEPRWGSRRIGYLRAGSVIHRGAEPVATGPRCAQGWYRVEPRGHVCVGGMASLDPQHPVVRAAAHTPKLDGLPYLYVLGRSPPPALYARLPSRAEQYRFEHDLAVHLTKGTLPFGLPAPDPVPPWLAPGSPPLGLGNEWRGPDRVRLGHARGRSGFALIGTVEHEGRRFGITTALEILALDRTKLVKQSSFSGAPLGDALTLPVAFVKHAGAFRVYEESDGLRAGAPLALRSAVGVTEQIRHHNGTSYLVAKDGTLVRESDVTVVRAPRHPPAWADEGGKWIDVSLARQSLVAYEGLTPVYATLVSTGVGGSGDPETTHATVQGIFKVYEKHLSVTMDGHETSDSFDLRDVPFVQYFHKGYALHAAYWHDDFGHAHSHGCVNLAPVDAAWLYRWTDPRMPTGWHGAMVKEGTIVFVH